MSQAHVRGEARAQAPRVPASLLRVIYRHRNWLAGLPLLPALFITRWEWENDPALWSLAILLCLAGIGIRAWARCYNGYGQRTRRDLATDGPYAYCRNPLYWGNTLLVLGALVASEVVLMLPIALLWCLAVYHAVALHEEVRLRQRYGRDYLGYRQSVPAWIPRFARRPLDRAVPPGRFAGAFVSQLVLLAVLLPFLLKELNPFGIWPHP